MSLFVTDRKVTSSAFKKYFGDRLKIAIELRQMQIKYCLTGAPSAFRGNADITRALRNHAGVASQAPRGCCRFCFFVRSSTIRASASLTSWISLHCAQRTKVEYLYLDLGTTNVRMLDPGRPNRFIDYGFRHRENIVRAGLNFGFN